MIIFKFIVGYTSNDKKSDCIVAFLNYFINSVKPALRNSDSDPFSLLV